MGTVAVRGAFSGHGNQSFSLFSRRSGSHQVYTAILFSRIYFYSYSFLVDHLLLP